MQCRCCITYILRVLIEGMFDLLSTKSWSHCWMNVVSAIFHFRASEKLTTVCGMASSALFTDDSVRYLVIIYTPPIMYCNGQFATFKLRNSSLRIVYELCNDQSNRPRIVEETLFRIKCIKWTIKTLLKNIHCTGGLLRDGRIRHFAEKNNQNWTQLKMYSIMETIQQGSLHKINVHKDIVQGDTTTCSDHVKSTNYTQCLNAWVTFIRRV